MSPLDELLAKQQITEVLYRYCRGVDRLDESLVRSCYHPDASDDHGSFQGGIDAYVEWVFRLLRKYDTTFHFLGNVLVELDAPASARSEAYGIAHHRKAGGAPHLNLVTGFRYVDRFERRDGEWRIAHRVAVTEWSRIDDAAAWWSVPDHFVHGRRDRSDPVYPSDPPPPGGAG